MTYQQTTATYTSARRRLTILKTNETDNVSVTTSADLSLTKKVTWQPALWYDQIDFTKNHALFWAKHVSSKIIYFSISILSLSGSTRVFTTVQQRCFWSTQFLVTDNKIFHEYGRFQYGYFWELAFCELFVAYKIHTFSHLVGSWRHIIKACMESWVGQGRDDPWKSSEGPFCSPRKIWMHNTEYGFEIFGTFARRLLKTWSEYTFTAYE